MVYGVDVHDGYQAGLNFNLLRQQGYTFAAVKLTQGTDYTRDLGDDWVRAARAAGLIPGAYHWINRSDGAAQARWFWRKVQECGGPAGMLIQLDCEDNATWADVQAWHAEWMRLSGGHPYLLYTGAWWWAAKGRGWPGSGLTPYLWHSHYLDADGDTAPDDPAAFAARIPTSWWVPGYGGWASPTILQFTSKGDAGGLGNNVDLNVYRGSREQMLALTRPIGSLEDDMAGQLPDDFAMNAQQAFARIGALFGNEDKVTWPQAPTPGEENKLKRALAQPAPLQLTAEDRAAIVGDLLAALRPEIRDAVADLGEGGAAQVRAGG